MLNGEPFLFDEMVFDALRVGYDKHHTLKKLNNGEEPGNIARYSYKRPIESNYTSIRHDRLLLCDTAYVNKQVSREVSGDYIGYEENEVLYDPVEIPNATTRLSLKRLEKAKKQLLSTSDSIEKIAKDNGFWSPNYFIGNFYHKFKMLPEVLRQEQQK
jgi:hypothetical protein